jgi:hypothetical protein
MDQRARIKNARPARVRVHFLQARTRRCRPRGREGDEQRGGSGKVEEIEEGIAVRIAGRERW